MSWEAMRWVYDHSRIRGKSFVVLLTIAKHCHAGGGKGAAVGLDCLAREARTTRRTVVSAIDASVCAGELLVIRRGGGNGLVNQYELPLVPASVKTVKQLHSSEERNCEIGAKKLCSSYTRNEIEMKREKFRAAETAALTKAAVENAASSTPPVGRKKDGKVLTPQQRDWGDVNKLASKAEPLIRKALIEGKSPYCSDVVEPLKQSAAASNLRYPPDFISRALPIALSRVRRAQAGSGSRRN
jgi:hypothetical protein